MHAEPVYSPQDYALLFQKGEEIGFAWFFRQLYPSLTFFTHKITGDKPSAEEIASMAFIKIWKRHEQFSSPEGIRAYLYQIVRNDALKWLKKRQYETITHKEVTYLTDCDKEVDHLQHLVTAETTRQLLRTIDLLPPECSKVFRLLFIEGKTVLETSKELNLSPSTIKTQKARGLAVLKTKLSSFFCGLF